MSDERKIKVTASVEAVKYFKNNWGIVQCTVDRVKEGDIDVGDYITVKGVMPQPKVGFMYFICAKFVHDPKWGDQYEAINMSSAVVFKDDDEKGKKKFLLSLFTDLQVKNMYEALDDPFMVLGRQDIKSLIKVKNVQLKTAANWITRFSKNYTMAKAFIELEDYDLTNNMIEKLIDRYGSADLVIDKVKNNPYILVSEVKGVGWKRADQIAMSGGMSPSDPKRIGAYMLYYLNYVGEDGFSWITPDELLGAVLEELGEDITDEAITEALHSIEHKLWWNDDKTKIGLQRYYNMENRVAQELIRLRDADSILEYGDWEKAVHNIEEKQGWQYNEQQWESIKLALESNVCIIYGLSGTGKSSSVSALLEIYKDYSFVQTSLSGRAASRMSEITGEEGYTIHRLLGYPKGDPEHQKFFYHEDNKLTYHIYILDEISMIDSWLFYNLLRAIPDGAKLIMLGDPGQLESIGSGNVAHDMINSPEVPSIELTQIHRQAAKSAIITESIKIRKGQQIIAKDYAGREVRGELKDLSLNIYSDKSNTYYEVMKQFSKCMSEKDFNILECQVLVPMKMRGQACTYNLNNAIQDLYNPKSKLKKETTVYQNNRPMTLRVGDKVINTQNNYSVWPNIYNGNIGIIKKIGYDYEEESKVMVIDFYKIGEVKIPTKYWNGINLGYAITTHKAQGSEWDTVIYGLDFDAYSLLTREQVYTAITRAKKICYMISQCGALRMAVSKESVSAKQTHLEGCLHDAAHPKLVF